MSEQAKGLSRDFVVRSMLKLFDEAETKKQWGDLNYVIIFKAGQPQYIKRYFEETITHEEK